MTTSAEAPESVRRAPMASHYPIHHRIPWLWHDYVVEKTGVPLWLLCLLLFLLLHGWAITLAGSAGHLSQFLGDLRWTILTVAPALGAFILAYTPAALTRFWQNLRPWLADTEAEIAALEEATPKLVMRFFWPYFVTVTFFMGVFSFLGTDAGWFQDYPDLGALRYVPLSTAPFVGYFVGGALAIASGGLGMFAQSLHRRDLRGGFILEGGKAALRPFNQLLWAIWGIFTVPTIFIMLLSVLDQSGAGVIGTASGVTLFVMLGATIIMPHLFMNQWLAQEKAQEVRSLRRALREAADIPSGSPTEDILRQMHRYQDITQRLQEARSFSPTLIDSRLVIQVSTSVVGIVAANVLLRTFILRG
jgi:hypothetical protein